MTEQPAERPRYGGLLAAVVLTGIALYVVGRTAELFLLLFFAVLMALFLSAIADFVVRRTHVYRWVALTGAVLFSIGMTALVIALMSPPVTQQFTALSATLPATVAHLESAFDDIAARIPGLAAAYPPGQHRAVQVIASQMDAIVTGAAQRLYGYAPRALAAASAAVMAIYLAADPARYVDAAVAYVPPRERSFVRSLIDDLGQTMRSWIVGQLLNMLILGVMMAAGLKLLGVSYWLAFGVLTFAAALVPFFGSIFATLVPALVVLGGEGDVTRAVGVLALGLFVHLFEGNVLAPLVMSVQVDLPPVTTMFGILVMGWLLGPLGVLLAVPILAALHVIMQRVVVERLYRTERYRMPVTAPDASAPAPPTS